MRTRTGPGRGVLRPERGRVSVPTEQPQCTGRVPCRTTNGTENRTQTTAAHAAQDRRRRDPPRKKPSRGPEQVQHGAHPEPLPRRGHAAGTMSPVLGRPQCAPRSRPVNSGAKAPGVAERHQGVGKADQSTESTRAGRGQAHRAGPRGTPERHAAGHNQAHGQLPSNNSRRVLQYRNARRTRNEPHHQNRCKATPAAVQMDVCAPSSDPTPCRLLNSRRQDGRMRTRQHTQPLWATKQPPSRWMCACPEHSQPLRATKSRCPDGRVRTPQRSSTHPALFGRLHLDSWEPQSK